MSNTATQYVRYLNNSFVVSLVLLCCCGCVVTDITPVKIGNKDADASKQLVHFNRISQLRSQGEYEPLAAYLEESLPQYSNDVYATRRVLNELATIYSYNVLNLEKAVDIDEVLLGLDQRDAGSRYLPTSTAAGQTLLGSQEYIDAFVDIDVETIERASRSRTMRNESLLNGREFALRDRYQNAMLENNYRLVSQEIDRAGERKQLKFTLKSRAIKVEFEMMRNERNFSPNGCEWFTNKQMEIDQVDQNEIDFLELADYFIVCFERTNRIGLAEMALQTLYKPYSYIKSTESRLKYNSRINEYIDILISANYREKRFAEMLYYISLNKSRVLLEKMQSNVSLNQDQRIIKAKNGALPDKDEFLAKVRRTDNFYDFYVINPLATNTVKSQSVELNNLLASRRIQRMDSLGSSSNLPTTPPAAQLMVSFVHNGTVQSKRYSALDTQVIQRAMNEAYGAALTSGRLGSGLSQQITSTLFPFPVDSSLYVSVDSFLAEHSLSLYSGKDLVRVLNLFTLTDVPTPRAMNIAGFFNPTGDLIGSEQEAELIDAYFPSSSQLLVRHKASLEQLKNTNGFNVMHLSMHGVYAPDDPLSSALIFSEFLNNKEVAAASTYHPLSEFNFGDSGTLSAREMENISALKNNHLVFTAACQTGIVGESRDNRKEIEGILRPLLLNNNRYLLLSLWDIADNSARDFVDVFYRSLQESSDVKASFFLARDFVKENYGHSRHWAPYYLVQN